jgi:hypothetical protein
VPVTDLNALPIGTRFVTIRQIIYRDKWWRPQPLTAGAGIYRLGDKEFSHFVKAAMEKFPADSETSFNPFDISIWKVLQEVVSPQGDELATTVNWKIFQRQGGVYNPPLSSLNSAVTIVHFLSLTSAVSFLLLPLRSDHHVNTSIERLKCQSQ